MEQEIRREGEDEGRPMTEEDYERYMRQLVKEFRRSSTPPERKMAIVEEAGGLVDELEMADLDTAV